MPKLDGIEAARQILHSGQSDHDTDPGNHSRRELVAAIRRGVFKLPREAVPGRDLIAAIATVQAPAYEELATVREEAASLAEALEARQAIERAKGLLMEREALTEREAFARLRQASQISGRSLGVIAEAVVIALGER